MIVVEHPDRHAQHSGHVYQLVRVPLSQLLILSETGRQVSAGHPEKLTHSLPGHPSPEHDGADPLVEPDVEVEGFVHGSIMRYNPPVVQPRSTFVNRRNTMATAKKDPAADPDAQAILEEERRAAAEAEAKAAPAESPQGNLDEGNEEVKPLPELPEGWREHIANQGNGKWAAGFTPVGQTEAEFIGDDFNSEDEARTAVREAVGSF